MPVEHGEEQMRTAARETVRTTQDELLEENNSRRTTREELLEGNYQKRTTRGKVSEENYSKSYTRDPAVRTS